MIVKVGSLQHKGEKEKRMYCRMAMKRCTVLQRGGVCGTSLKKKVHRKFHFK